MTLKNTKSEPAQTANPLCELCGEPMPVGEEMFNYHGYSGPCPKPAPEPAPSPATKETPHTNLKTGFHWSRGWYFKRMDDGSVRVSHVEGEWLYEQLMIPENEWASIVCSVSTDGETGERWQQARNFHGMPQLDAETASSQGPATKETPDYSAILYGSQAPAREETPPTEAWKDFQEIFALGRLAGAAAPRLEISQWIDTELWNFAHALALDLGLSHDAAGEKSKEELIHRSMSAVIGICLRMAGAAALPSAQNDYVLNRLIEEQRLEFVRLRNMFSEDSLNLLAGRIQNGLSYGGSVAQDHRDIMRVLVAYFKDAQPRELPSPPVPSKEPK